MGKSQNEETKRVVEETNEAVEELKEAAEETNEELRKGMRSKKKPAWCRLVWLASRFAA